MEFRFVTYKELRKINYIHPELAIDRPDLCKIPFPGNPIKGAPTFPFLFYALENGRVVGSRKAMPDRAIINGKEYSWAWCFDTIVDEGQQGKGIGSRLVKLQSDEFDRRGMIAGAAFSAPTMMRIYEKFGYRLLEFTPRMTLVRRVRPFLARKIENQLLLSFASRIATIALNLESVVRGATRSSSSFEFEGITKEEFCRRFGQKHLAEQPNSWAGSPDWVTSRARDGDEFLKVTLNSSTDPSVVFVLRVRDQDDMGREAPRRISLMYFKFLDDTNAADLLATVISRELFERSLDVADVITSSPSLLNALLKRGYRRRGTGMTFVYRVPAQMEIDGATDITDWHLTHFCSDGFLFA